ncbi:MAG: O-antigen ligase family protein [Chitinophagales bacterium]|nr:O-antigen ligase family protein [Chitinophagales bacterium]MCZ2392482.1 O-antigen ligase family protein [Chitinophagales bacterium]
MQSYPIQQWVTKNEKLLYYFIGVAMLIVMSLAVWIDKYYLAILPLLAIMAAIFTLQPYWLYLALIIAIPFSMEYEIGSLGLDLPSEPILIGLATLSIFWVLNKLESDAKKLLTSPIIWALSLHLIWAYICILSSSDSIISLKYALSKSWTLIGCVVGSYWLINQYHRLIVVLSVLFLSTIATIFIIMVRHGMDGFTFDSINSACNPIYRNHVIYGVFIVMVLPFVWILRNISYKHSVARLFIDCSLALFLVAIYFTYTRGAWLALPVMIIVIYIIHLKLMRFVLPISVVALILFFNYLSKDYRYLKYAPTYEKTIYHDELSEHLAATLEGQDMSTMERFHRWIAAFRMFKEKPLMGVGPNTFVLNYKPYTSTSFETYISDNEEKSTVHNYFIYILVEQGIFGFVILLILVGTFFIYGEYKYHQLKDPQYQLLYLACLLCGITFWLNNMFSDLLEANKVAPLWLFSIAWMLRIEQWDNQKHISKSL